MKDRLGRGCFTPAGVEFALAAFGAAVAIVLPASASASGLFDVFTPDDGTKTFFFQFVIAGGPIVWVILLPMSVITCYLAIDLAFSIRRKKLLPAGASDRIVKAAENPGPAEIPAKFSDSGDLLSGALSDAIVRSKQSNDNYRQLSRFAADALQGRAMHLLRKVEWCNIIGNVAPMVGLFGTVFGMIKAFNLLGISGGQPRPDQLAAAISIALITTFWGLLIAIPALAIAGIFHTRIQTIFAEAAMELEALLARIKLHGLSRQQGPESRKLQPQQPPKTRPVPKVPIKEVSVPTKNAKQPMPTNRPKPLTMRQQPAKDGTGVSKRQFPVKRGS